MKGRTEDEEGGYRPAMTLLSCTPLYKISPFSLRTSTPFFPLFSPWVTWSRTGRHGNPRQSRWKLNRGTLFILFLSLFVPSISLSPIFVLAPSLSRFIYVPNVFASRFLSLCHFQIISRPIMLFLTPGGFSLCVLFLRSPRCETLLSPTLASQSPGLVSLTQRAPNRNGKRTDALGEALPS